MVEYTNLHKIKDFFLNKFNEINNDYNYSPLSNTDIIDLIYKFNITSKLDYNSNDFIKYKDCEFFNSNDLTNNTPSVFNTINKCFSITGKNILAFDCTNITNSIDILQKRQNDIIKINNKVSKLIPILHKFCNIENRIYWHLKDKTQEFNDVCDTLYFKNKWLQSINNNKKILSIYYFFLIIWTPLWGLFGPILFFFIPYLFSYYILKINIPFKFYWNQLKNMLFGSQLFTILKIIKEGFNIMTHNNTFKSKTINIIFDIIISPFGRWLYFSLLLISYIWSITNNFITSFNTHKFTSFIHDRIHNIWELFTLTKNAIIISGFNTDLLNNKFFNKILSSKQIINNSSIFKLKGECLTIYWELYNNQNGEINTILQCIKYLGMVDKLVCLSRLVNENNFTFVEYLTNTTSPKLECFGMFNPTYLNSCIKNNLCLFNNNTNVLDNQNDLDSLNNQNDLDSLNNQDNQNDNKNNQNDKLDNQDNQNDNKDNQNDLDVLDNQNNQNDNQNNQNDNKDNQNNQNDNKDNQDDKLDNQNDNQNNQNDNKDNQNDKLDNQNDNQNNQNDNKDNQDDNQNNQNDKQDNQDDLDVLDNQNNQDDKQDNQDDKCIKQNCILTGPNGSGKSSLLKTIIINIILGQTIGIVSCDKLRITPFKYISSYLNIADAQGKESLFQAEMSRCHNHLEKLKTLENIDNGFSFNIMDEIFVSTNYFEGVSGAYAIIKNLEKYKKSINIITTHFDILTYDKYKQPSYCFKYFTINNNGKKDYLIRNGVNKKHCALSLLKEKGFDSDLCLDANIFYKEIKNLNIQ